MSGSEISVEKLADFCNSLARDIMKEHEKRFADRLRAVQEASNALGNAATRLASSVKNAWGSIDKTALEYGTRLAQFIQDASRTLSQAKVELNYHETEKFHETSVEALNKIIVTVRKYVPKLHRGLKPEMAALNSSLARLENSVRTLGAALDGSPGGKIDSLQRDAKLLVEKHSLLLKLRIEERQENDSLEAIAGQEKDLLAHRQELSFQEEFRELTRYEDALSSKGEEIRQFLQPVVKPLLKLERALSSSKSPTIDTRTLHGLVDTPVEAVTTGQTFAISALLTQLEEALKQGKLEVEDRRRRKAEEIIDSVKSGTTEKLREEYLTIQANVQETLRQLIAKGFLEKRDRLNEQFTDMHAKKESITARLIDSRRRIDDISKTLAKQKNEIESEISKIAHKSIIIQIE